MNLPDFTLLLQIANFCVAYLIMRKLVFAPALKILETQDSYKKSLKQKITTTQVLQHDVTQEQYTRWHKAQKSLYAFIPKLSQIFLVKKEMVDQAQIHEKVVSEDEKKSLIAKLCEQLSDISS